MSPRRARRKPGPPPGERPSTPSGSHERVEEHPDGDWVVRSITGSSSTKNYRCPGCDQEIRPATPHVVAGPADGYGGVDERRHWHTACWRSRGRRAPNTPRGRNAPKR
jgi:hypothetical protein